MVLNCIDSNRSLAEHGKGAKLDNRGCVVALAKLALGDFFQTVAAARQGELISCDLEADEGF